jgi:hypothetical protein
MNKKYSILSLKGLFVMLFASMAICFTSCDKSNDIVEQEPAKARPMELLYNESKGLPETSADSVTNFAQKFCNHLNSNLNDQNDEFFHPIIENIEYAGSLFGYKITITTSVGITINDEWDGEYHISF